MKGLAMYSLRLVLACLLLVLQAHAADEQGRLWHISGKGADSYLFGTMHSDDPRVTQLSVRLGEYLEQADTLMLELALDAQTTSVVTMSMMLPAGRTLSAVVGRKLARQAQQAMLSKGIPPELTERFQPWAIVVTLSMPEQHSGEFLDKVLYQRAQQSGKRFRALESAEEQVGVFSKFSEQEQAEMLRHVLMEYETYPAMFEAMTEAYLAGDLQRLQEISDGSPMSGDMALQERFMAELLQQRNRRMVKRIVPLLQKEKLFIGVGALHLAGEEGLIPLLRQQGYQVESVE